MSAGAKLRRRLRQALSAARLEGLYALWHGLARADPRRLRRQLRFRRWNCRHGPHEIVVRPGLRLSIDPRSREPFEWFCFRSIEMAGELDGFVREMRTRRRFLDVGACHGIFSLAFAQGRPATSVVAVEPSAIAYSILAENIRLGGLTNVVARQVACGATSGMLRMRQSWHHLEALPYERQATASGAPEGPAGGSGDGGRVTPGDPAGNRHDGPVIAIPMQSVDELCVELGFEPDLVKIDVEGYELAVLGGARSTLGRHRPHIFLELHPRRLRELGGSVEEVVDLLAGLGYGFHRPGGAALSRRAVVRRASVSRVLCIAAGRPA